MLSSDKMVTLSKRVRSLLIYKVIAQRPMPSNCNDTDHESIEQNDNEPIWVKSVAPQFNALSSGHGSGF